MPPAETSTIFESIYLEHACTTHNGAVARLLDRSELGGGSVAEANTPAGAWLECGKAHSTRVPPAETSTIFESIYLEPACTAHTVEQLQASSISRSLMAAPLQSQNA